jgi:CO/xanthine dehydrogenase FAD-binding subunit
MNTVLALPDTVAEATEALDADPDAHVLAGGTDFMVQVNFGHRRPPSVVALRGVTELQGWRQHDGHVRLGACLTYTQAQAPELAALVPALAQASRTVGSPQIRNAGTIGGNVGTASPAGDALPVLAALDAMVEVASSAGRRSVPLDELVVGPKRTTLGVGEIITAITVPVLRGAQEYLKVGTRNAMVISVADLALVVDLDGRTVRCALGSVGPTVLRARDAEAWIADRVDWDAVRLHDVADADEFGAQVAAAARPIDDHRSTAAYRRHAVGILARRALVRALG